MNDVWEVNSAYAILVEQTLDGERVTTRNSGVFRLPCHKTAVFCFDRTPLVSLRKTAWRNALREWQWIMSGSNLVEDLHLSVRPWWQPWADEEGFVRFNYGCQFRNFYGRANGVDQIKILIDGVRSHPNSRRNLLTTWNAADMVEKECKITNCHNTVTQAFVDKHNKLHLKTYQRSVDVIVGLPCNWIQMWAFLQWLAYNTGREVGTLTWIGGDVHIYEKHADLANEIANVYFGKWCGREKPVELKYKLKEEGVLMPEENMEYTFIADDFYLVGDYEPIIQAKAEMVV